MSKLDASHKPRNTLGQVAYEAYERNFRIIRSMPTPWSQLPAGTQAAWTRVAAAIQLRVLQPLLDTPADVPAKPAPVPGKKKPL